MLSVFFMSIRLVAINSGTARSSKILFLAATKEVQYCCQRLPVLSHSPASSTWTDFLCGNEMVGSGRVLEPSQHHLGRSHQFSTHISPFGTYKPCVSIQHSQVVNTTRLRLWGVLYLQMSHHTFQLLSLKHQRWSRWGQHWLFSEEQNWG